jgi:hypothetical protein
MELPREQDECSIYLEYSIKAERKQADSCMSLQYFGYNTASITTNAGGVYPFRLLKRPWRPV